MLTRKEQIKEIDNDIYLTFRRQLAKGICVALVGGILWVIGGWSDPFILQILRFLTGALIGGISYLGGGATVVFFFTALARFPTTDFNSNIPLSRKDAVKGTAIILIQGIIALMFCFSCLSLFDQMGTLLTFGMTLVLVILGVVVYISDFLNAD